jgi:hypothetical protein
VFVIEPAAHTMQEAKFGPLEYSPAAHTVHAVAPAAEPVSVIEPAWHGKQNDFPPEPW